MGKPYSIDLRERVVRAVEEKGMSRRQAAAHFGVSYSTAIAWVARRRRTGSVVPDRMGGHRPTGRRRSPGGIATGWCSAAGRSPSPCAGWSPSWRPSGA